MDGELVEEERAEEMCGGWRLLIDGSRVGGGFGGLWVSFFPNVNV